MSAEPAQKEALQRAINVAGGVSALALALEVAASAPSMWKARGNVPAEYCPAIERLTRAHGEPVMCEELRPDVEWSVLRQPGAGLPVTEDAKAA